MAFCINCGKPLPEKASFCPECGADLRAWTQPVAEKRPVQMPQQQIQTQKQPVPQPQYIPTQPAKPLPKPGGKLTTAGKTLSIIGFAESVLGLLLTFAFMALMMSLSNIRDYSDTIFHFIILVVETLALSILGVIFSNCAEKKGNTKTTAGKRFGWIGIAFSAVAAVNIILCIIVFVFSGSTLLM